MSSTATTKQHPPIQHWRSDGCVPRRALRSRFANAVARLLFVIVAGLAGVPAFAQECDTVGHGAPRVANIATTSSTIVVSWFLVCMAPPQSMELRQNGTDSHFFQDGRLLGSASVGPLQNAGAVSAPNLSPDTTFQGLRLCPKYLDSPPFCTGTFGARTASASSDAPAPPTNFRAVVTSGGVRSTIHLSWQNSAGANQLNLTRVPGVNNQPSSSINIFGPNLDTSSDVPDLQPATTYQFTLCEVNVHGQNCAQASARTPAPPLAPEPFVIVVTAARTGPGAARITWTKPNVPFDSFDVERR